MSAREKEAGGEAAEENSGVDAADSSTAAVADAGVAEPGTGAAAAVPPLESRSRMTLAVARAPRAPRAPRRMVPALEKR